MARKDDGMAEMLDDLESEANGWRRVRHPETGDILAVLPETAKDAKKWEADCQVMHANQAPITLDDLPELSNQTGLTLTEKRDGGVTMKVSSIDSPQDQHDSVCLGNPNDSDKLPKEHTKKSGSLDRKIIWV